MRSNQCLWRRIVWSSFFLLSLPPAFAAQTPEKLPMDLIELLGELDENDQANLEEALLEAEQATATYTTQPAPQASIKGR